jgi:hypothetical protein
LFQLAANIMIAQLIISVVISSLRRANGSAFQTEDQKGWLSTKRLIGVKFHNFQKDQLTRGFAWAQRLAKNTL